MHVYHNDSIAGSLLCGQVAAGSYTIGCSQKTYDEKTAVSYSTA